MPRPVQVYSFADFASRTPNVPPPGDRLDAQFRAHADAIAELHRVIDELKARVAAAERPAARETLPVNSYPGVGGPYAGDTLGATATAADWAQVAIDWAEHLPDTIPGNSLAVTGVSGDHWSSRWWANNAATQISAQLGNYLPIAGGTMTGRLSIPLVSNLSVGGGATGQVLTTAGSGVLAWSTVSGVFVDAPSNSQYYSRFNGGWVVSPGGLTDAPNDATAYARKSQAWSHLTHADITDWTANVPVVSTTLPLMDGAAAIGGAGKWADAAHVHPTDSSRAPLASPVFTGTVTLPGPPTLPLHAATKAYVDAGVYLPVSGGTLTGPLTGTSAAFSSTLGVTGAATFSGGVTVSVGGLNVTGGNLGVANAAFLSGTLVVTGAATFNGGVVGVTNGSDAAAGQIGEFQTASHAPTATGWNAIGQAVSLALTAGDWDVWGTATLTGSGGTLVTAYTVSVSLTAGAHGANLALVATPAYPANGQLTVAVPRTRVSVSTGTTAYIMATYNGSGGSPLIAGTIAARRAR